MAPEHSLELARLALGEVDLDAQLQICLASTCPVGAANQGARINERRFGVASPSALESLPVGSAERPSRRDAPLDATSSRGSHATGARLAAGG